MNALHQVFQIGKVRCFYINRHDRERPNNMLALSFEGGRGMSLEHEIKLLREAIENLTNAMLKGGASKTAQAAVVHGERLLYAQKTDLRGRAKGTVPKCSRCRREGRCVSPKRNGRCIECEYEEWWTE